MTRSDCRAPSQWCPWAGLRKFRRRSDTGRGRDLCNGLEMGTAPSGRCRGAAHTPRAGAWRSAGSSCPGLSTMRPRSQLVPAAGSLDSDLHTPPRSTKGPPREVVWQMTIGVFLAQPGASRSSTAGCSLGTAPQNRRAEGFSTFDKCEHALTLAFFAVTPASAVGLSTPNSLTITRRRPTRVVCGTGLRAAIGSGRAPTARCSPRKAHEKSAKHRSGRLGFNQPAAPV